ncbi:MAG: hypothetical protein MZV65_17085 [Chromatiales bacterium]|nr:hypothetical protein [Chromatiales bacterium]
MAPHRSSTTSTRRPPTSTSPPGAGPYSEAIDAVTVGEWWTLAENDVIEMTKRGVPGVWTFNFFDG